MIGNVALSAATKRAGGRYDSWFAGCNTMMQNIEANEERDRYATIMIGLAR